MWDAVACGELPCEHDAYQKVFQLDRARRAAAMDGYDIVMLDEAHDCSAAQIDIVVDVRGSTIIVFDGHQRIYGFRRAVGLDVLRGLAARAVASRRLTQTWRYGEPLASIAEALVRQLGGDARFSIAHNPQQRTNVVLAARGPPFAEVCGIGHQLVLIARQNHTLFEAAIGALASGHVRRIYTRPFETVGGPEALLDVYTLSIGGSASVMHDRHGLAARCATSGGGYALYRRLALRDNEAEQKVAAWDACRFIDRYGLALPSIVARLRSALTAELAEADAAFFTTHRAKGLGWPYTYICSDFMTSGLAPSRARATAERASTVPLVLFSRGEPLWRHVFSLLHRSLPEEVNLLYVALTRAVSMVCIARPVALWLAEAGVLL